MKDILICKDDIVPFSKSKCLKHSMDISDDVVSKNSIKYN